MRRIVHSAAAAAFGSLLGGLAPNVSAPANAADLPQAMPVKALPSVAIYNWTGLYVGAQGGYQSGTFRTREYITSTGLPTSLDEQHGTEGWVGGVHAGYNSQTGSIVWGIEADIETADLRAGYRYASGDGTDFRSRWQGSLRGRVGAVWNSLLLYATGGLAFADLEHVYVPGLNPVEPFRRTETGWTVGTGAEWMFAPAWRARVEYRFSDYGRISNVSPAFQATYRHDPQFHTVRAGVSYSFGAPVVAKY